jgi:Ca2+-binding EF-hand superfamily protein
MQQSSKSNSVMGKKPASKKAPPPELTEDQKQEIREAFDLFDTDGSGASSLGFTYCRMPSI